MNQFKTSLLNAGIITIGLATLAGCGGGGDGGIAAVSPTTVSGTASKGLVKQAKVLVCRIVNGVPEADASCASTTTGNDGSYSVTFKDGFTGSAMVKVMASTTGSASMMTDETTGRDIPYNMTMRAVIPAVSSKTAAYVTPFSEMAASAVSKEITIDATKINQAIGTVQSAMAGLGIDLSVMPMMDIKNNAADSSLLGMQSNMVKQLSRVAMVAKTDLLKDASGVPCNATTNPSLQIACTVTAMADVMSSYASSDPTKIAALVQALNAQKVTGVTIPIYQPDGTVVMQLANMTDPTSMQTVLENAGMTTTTATTATNVMMGSMH